jgi:hypothetical protein
MSVRQATAVALNTTAAAANAGTGGVLSAMCRDELRAVGHVGSYRDGHCTRSDAPREASAEQRAALAAVRARWAPVLVAVDELATAHDVARAVVEANDDRNGQRYLDALARLFEAYDSLRRLAAPFGLSLPALMGGN